MTVILHRAGRNRLSEEFRFLKTWIAHPRATGAIAPSGTAMARRMAAAIDPSSGLPVLELGPGTGAMTRAIVERGLPQAQLWSLEYEASFLAHLKRAFPQVNFIQGDAFDLANSLPADAPQAFDCVISSLPLLNFPVARRTVLICDLLSRLPRGRPVLQFSYGPTSPVPPSPGLAIIRLCRVWRNLPPAIVWSYTRV